MTQASTQPTVLVVEDDPEVRGAVGEVLHTGGYDVVMAANGREALWVLAHMDALPALVLLDLTMPKMDGLSFLEKLQADEVLRTLPVLVMTALEGTTPPGAVDLRCRWECCWRRWPGTAGRPWRRVAPGRGLEHHRFAARARPGGAAA